MSAIRYVCLSDLHLGQNDSLLTNISNDQYSVDLSKPSPVLSALCRGLSELIEQNDPEKPRPILILNGDILETALARMSDAAMAFERFIEEIFPEDKRKLFERIIYVPGNHDHHIWEIARETQYVNHVVRNKPAKSPLEDPWHTSNMFVEHTKTPLVGYLLTNLIRRHEHLRDFQIEIAYPNFGLYNNNRSQAVVFHHGHFVESIYQLMTIIAGKLFPDYQLPRQIWDLEADNFAWIDFFWSSLGRSGRVGPLVQKAYNSLGYKKARDTLIGNLAHSLAKDHDLPGWGDQMETVILKKGLTMLADWFADRERKRKSSNTKNEPLSDEAIEGLKKYLCGPLRDQIMIELEQNMPDQITFAFGHTHKPYSSFASYNGYKGNVEIYNTGGWVVETIEPAPMHGASVLVLDEDLNAASLCLYKEDDNRVHLMNAASDASSTNPMIVHLKKALEQTEQTWKTFSEIVEKQIENRQKALKERLNIP